MSQAIDGRTSPTAQYGQNSVRHRSNTVSGRYYTLDGEATLENSDTALKTAECYKCHVEEVQSEMFQLYHDTFRSCQWNNVVICKPCKVKLEDGCPKCHNTVELIEHSSRSIPSEVEDVQDQMQEGQFSDDHVITCLSFLFQMAFCGIVIYAVLHD